MKRVPLTDGSGRWFDRDKAECVSEGTRWNGNNHISMATGSQWEHEYLYYTASGQWVKYSWSQWQGSGESYDLIDADEAAAWLTTNGREHPAVAEEIVSLEIT